MQRIQVVDLPPSSDRPLVLCIGKFDGVHIGHQAILTCAKSYLSEDESLAVMSLWPHPAYVLGGDESFARSLTPVAEKTQQLAAYGVEVLYDVAFSRDYASTSAPAFVEEHLGQLQVRRIIVGQDFHFGQGGQADVRDLERLCSGRGIPVSVVDHVAENGTKVSSSQIRAHLGAGRVEAAEALLGRPYSLNGEVVHGEHLGRQLGFPTANLLETEGYVLPGGGVYAVSAAVGDDNWFGVMNAGMRPTVDGKTFRMEVHLLDFDGDLYGRQMRVSLLRRVRDERRFAGLDDLKAQIAVDVETVRSMFGIR